MNVWQIVKILKSGTKENVEKHADALKLGNLYVAKIILLIKTNVRWSVKT